MRDADAALGPLASNRRKDTAITDNDPLLTISEAAELLRTPVATLRYWRHRGIGPVGIKLGRRVLYRSSALHAWIDEQSRLQTA